jgi:hypothetical protein
VSAIADAFSRRENIRVLDDAKYFGSTFLRMEAMPEVLVCAEPDIREEATEFVSKLGVRPQICSVGSLMRCRENRKKTKLIFVYLKGNEPRAVADGRALVKVPDKLKSE